MSLPTRYVLMRRIEELEALLADETKKNAPLTAAALADAFDAMWNAALGVSNERQEGAAVASMLAEGFRQMAYQLRHPDNVG